MQTKRCNKCKENKSLSSFRKVSKSKDGYCYYCRPCETAITYRARYKDIESSERFREKQRLYREKKNQNPEWVKKETERKRLHNLTKRYSITTKFYNNMLEEQNNLCAICGKEFNNSDHVHDKPNIDHCHKTGKIRGIVHSKCNSMIGFAEDDVEKLEEAIKYLKKHNGD